MTPEELRRCLGCKVSDSEKWAGPITAAARAFQIDTPQRLAAWVAQVGHESGLLTILEENLRYSAEGLLKTFPRYFDECSAHVYAKNPEAIANRVYGGRMGNGYAATGDGWKYRGRGLIQITGRANYEAAGRALGLDLVGQPDLVLQPQTAAMTAGFFWESKGLSALADLGAFDKITRAINGGFNGKEDRDRLHAQARAALGC